MYMDGHPYPFHVSRHLSVRHQGHSYFLRVAAKSAVLLVSVQLMAVSHTKLHP